MIEALNLVPDFLEDLVSDNLLDALSRGVIRMEPLCQIALERSIPEVTDIRAAIRFTCRVTRSAASAGSRSYWLLNHNVPTRDVARFAQSLAERRDPLGQIQASCGRSRPAAIARPALQLIARLRRRSIAGKVWLTATVSFAVARHGHATRNWDTTA